ncbi:MAG: CcmD family protein [Bacteroidetes bacterium]|nr:MAG: CcmD family protein [Bacteroidota bacterium]
MNKAMIQILLQVQAEPMAASTQKFDVVIGVIGLVFLGIVGYLIYLDKKLKKLEDK